MSLDLPHQRMIQEQLLHRGIRDPRVLEAFAKVPRHLFVPPDRRPQSYEDHPVAIGEGQTLSQPYITALMTETLQARADSKVLEIGTGSGYQTALLAEMASRVCSVERLPSLAESAGRRLKELGYTHIEIRVGDGSLGWPEKGPFDGILVAAAVPSIPQSLLDQLAPEGRLILPVGPEQHQKLLVVDRRQGRFVSRELCECLFVPLVGAQGFKEPA